MSGTNIGIILCIMTFSLHYTNGRQVDRCFTLTKTKKKYDWDDVPTSVPLTLSCARVKNSVISVDKVVHSIPLNRENFCPTNGCMSPTPPPSIDFNTSCVCCNAAGIDLCEVEIPLSNVQLKSCNFQTECEVKVKHNGLGSRCNEMIDYHCVNNKTKGEDIRKCRTRWVNITYTCIQADIPTTTGVMKSSIVGHLFPQSLTIALAVVVCFLILLIAVITTLFCLRHNRLKKKFIRERRLVSSEETDAEDASNNEQSVYYKAGPIQDSTDLVQPGLVTVQSTQTKNGPHVPLLEGAGETRKKHNYENIQDTTLHGQPKEYTKINKDLKMKNRSKDVDGSNHWHDPDKAKGIEVARGGDDGRNIVKHQGQPKGGYEDVEMIENVYYEGGSGDLANGTQSGGDRHGDRQRNSDKDYENI